MESENQTTIANTTIPRIKTIKASNFNGSLKIRLRGVRKSDYRNTDFSKTDISMYVCSDESQNKTILDLYKNRVGEVSSIAEKELKLLEGKLDLDLCELIFIKAKNNKRINDLENYIISKLKGVSKKNIKTLSEYEADVKSYSEKTYNKNNFKSNNSVKVPKVKTMFHNIPNRTENYTNNQLEETIAVSQYFKGISRHAIMKYYNIAKNNGLSSLELDETREAVKYYAKENNLDIPQDTVFVPNF